jgi:hypothetical protein
VEEIAMKKHRTVADLLVDVYVCIEASETRAQLLESHGKGPKKKETNYKEVTGLEAK